MIDDGPGPSDPTPEQIRTLCAEIQKGWTDEVKIARRQKVPVPIGAPAYVKRLAEYEIRETLEERRRTG
jgi:hypothetical protein